MSTKEVNLNTFVYVFILDSNDKGLVLLSLKVKHLISNSKHLSSSNCISATPIVDSYV